MKKLQQALNNRKTTIAGLVSAIAGFVYAFPDHFGGPDNGFVILCKFVSLGGLAVLGVCGKDFDRTGK